MGRHWEDLARDREPTCLVGTSSVGSQFPRLECRLQVWQRSLCVCWLARLRAAMRRNSIRAQLCALM